MYRKVLVPLDGSELAECALPHVIQMVKEGAIGEVTLLNVFQVDLQLPFGDEHVKRIDIDALREMLLKRSRKYLADVESRLGSEGINVKTVSLEGSHIADVIADYAQKRNIDMIVIATHGYTGLKKLMLGSVALKVLHDSSLPVLLIRPESCR